MADRNPQPEHGDGKAHLLLRHQGEPSGDTEHHITVGLGCPDGVHEERRGKGHCVKVGEYRPLQRYIQQVGRGGSHSQAVVAQPQASQPKCWQCPQCHDQCLRHQQGHG